MAGQKFWLRPCCQRRLAIILIVLGAVLTLAGIALFLIVNSASEAELMDPVEISTVVEQGADGSGDTITSSEQPADKTTVSEAPSVLEEADETTDVEETEVSEEVSDKDEIETEPVHFVGLDANTVGHTFLTADGTTPLEKDIPAFHSVSEITAEAGVNASTNEPSDNLHIELSSVPDREFSVSVLVSVDDYEISGTAPDQVQGLQWVLTYSDSVFKKAARFLTSDGQITDLDAEDFNIRFAGNDGAPEVDFYGPPGTRYYAVMIYDDKYFTLITP